MTFINSVIEIDIYCKNCGSSLGDNSDLEKKGDVVEISIKPCEKCMKAERKEGEKIGTRMENWTLSFD